MDWAWKKIINLNKISSAFFDFIFQVLLCDGLCVSSSLNFVVLFSILSQFFVGLQEDGKEEYDRVKIEIFCLSNDFKWLLKYEY